jgi:hypothetical protein
MKNVWRIKFVECKENNNWWNKLFGDGPKYNILLLKNNELQGTLAFSRTEQQALDIQEIVLNALHCVFTGENNVNEYTIV